MKRPLFLLSLAFGATSLEAVAYDPPPLSKPLLTAIDFGKASEHDANYRKAFRRCDGELGGGAGKNTFDGVTLKPPYLCADAVVGGKKKYGDPTRLAALLKLDDGAIFWHSKMALDVDGSWAAWNGLKGATDKKCTSYSWKRPNSCDDASTDPAIRANQIDTDKFPFIVMPTAGLKKQFGPGAAARGERFAKSTGLAMGDMGVAIHRDRWTPVFIADGGPFMRLGEGSARVFEELGQTRCKKWNDDRTRCIGPGETPTNECGTKPSTSRYPYCNSGISKDVIFVVYPGSADANMTPETARKTLCDFARRKLKLTGSSYCKGLES